MASNATIGNLRVLLTLDSAQFDKAVKSADASTQKLANTMKRDLAPSQTQINKLVRDFAGTQEIGNAIKYAKAIEQVGGVVKLSASEQARANKVLQEGAEKLRLLGPEFQKLNPHIAESMAKVKQFAAETKQAQTQTGSFGGAISSLRGVMGAFGVTLGAAAIVNFGKSALESAGKIVDLSAKTGLSTEAVQLYGAVARQTGGDLDTFADAIFKLGINIAKGGKEVDGALKQLGISAKEIRNAAPEQQMEMIADKLRAVTNDGERNRLGVLLYGKTWKDIAPGVVQGIKEIKDATTIASDATVRAADAAGDAWDRFLENSKNKTISWLGSMVMAIEVAQKRIETGKGPPLPAGMGGLGFNWVTAWLQGQNDSANPQRGKDINLPAPAKDKPEPLSAEALAALKEAQRTAKAWSTLADDEEIAKTLRAMQEFQKMDLTAEEKSVKELVLQIDEWLVGGRKLPPMMHQLREENIEFITSGLKVEDTFALMTKGAGDFTKKVVGVGDAYQDVFRRLEATNSRPFGGGIIKDTPFAALFKDSMSVSDLTKGVIPGQSLGKLFGAGVTDFTGDMSGKIMRAITGGGDIGKTLGALFGTSTLGKMAGKMGENGLFEGGIGKMLQGSFLGKKIGGFIGSMIPGLGALLGPAISAIIGKIGGIGKNGTLKDRQAFAQQQGFGDLNAMLDALGAAGPGGKALADMALRGIGKGDNEANRKWMADVQKFFEQQAKTTAAVSESIGKAQSALERFGGSAPKSLRPLIDNLLKSTQLTKDQRTALEGMAQTPSWQTIQQRAEALGIDFGALGGTFNQKRIADAGFGLQHDIEMFLENGADRDGVLRGMADELSALAAEAVRTGRALPKTLEMYIRRLQEMGLLVDEQGNAIAEGLMFQDMVDESLQKVVGVLEEIRDLLAGANQPPPVVSPPRIGDWNNGDGKSGEPGFRFGDADFGDGPDFNLPGFAGGTRGAYQDFGAGTPVMLHGRERVMTEAEGRGGSGMNVSIHAIDAASFEMFLRKGGANVIARNLPDASGRYVGRR